MREASGSREGHCSFFPNEFRPIAFVSHMLQSEITVHVMWIVGISYRAGKRSIKKKKKEEKNRSLSSSSSSFLHVLLHCDE